LPKKLNNKIVGAYRRLLLLSGYKIKSSVHGVPTLEFNDYLKKCHELVTGKRSYIFNDEAWGLGEESLEEFVVNSADWEKQYEKN